MIDLEERLRSRFEWGLVADIKPPDLETKVAIFNKKAEESGIRVPSDVGLYVASKIRSNVRELEGCLIRLAAFSSMTKTPITIAMAGEILRQMLQEEQKVITIEGIQKAVAQYFGIKVSDLKSKGRQRAITEPRQIAMFLARELTKASLPEIGRQFGGKDHSTVIHSCNKILSLRESNPTIQAAIDRIRTTLEA
jgi:chromosomal replication initiator protein